MTIYIVCMNSDVWSDYNNLKAFSSLEKAQEFINLLETDSIVRNQYRYDPTSSWYLQIDKIDLDQSQKC